MAHGVAMMLKASPKLGGTKVRTFLPGIVRSMIRELHLEKLRIKYQISLEFKLEVPLETYQVCNPPSGRVVLYKKYFPVRLRLPLFLFFIEFLRAVGLLPCVVVPNA